MKENHPPSPSSTAIETFCLDLGDGTQCTASVDVARIAAIPADKLPSVIAWKWEGPRKTSHFARYQSWAADVWQHVANAANKSIVSLLISPQGKLFAIVCEPSQKPQFVPIPLP